MDSSCREGQLRSDSELQLALAAEQDEEAKVYLLKELEAREKKAGNGKKDKQGKAS